ncbi:MAG: hypothetical protein QNK37_20765 [Acidobacteriota bacterium]|nr:hypothetical protein [Acidobacteriota bacterium]
MKHPWIFVKSNGCEGNWDDGWSIDLEPRELLPAAGEIAAAAGGTVCPPKLGVLVEDALLHPLRLTLEERAPARELEKFLTWKLKRFLPFDVSRAKVCSAPLKEDNTYMTWSLPGTWLDQLTEGLAAQGAQCGYVGGIFATLLENSPGFRGSKIIGLFDELFIYAELDRSGGYLDYRTRRLPLREDGSLDDETLSADWLPLLEDSDNMVFCDLRERPDNVPAVALGRLNVVVNALDASGSVLDRFTRWSDGKGGRQRLNFAPKPFVTGQGSLYLMWAVNLILILSLGAAAWYWAGLRRQNEESHGRIGSLQERQREVAEEHADAVRILENVDPRDYRKELEQFHGIQTAFETHWGRLLDDLSDLMNDDVRLVSLSPRVGAERKKNEATLLYLSGQARTKEAQLNLIRTLQGHQSFENVRFESEQYGEAGVALSFEISFRYKPAKQGGGV